MWLCPVITKTFNLFYFQNIAKGGIATRSSHHYSPKDFEYSKFSLYPLHWLVNSLLTMIILDVLLYPINFNIPFQDAPNSVFSQSGKITRKLKIFLKIFENCGFVSPPLHHTNVYKTSVCTCHFETGKVPYSKAFLPVVSIDIRLLLFRNCKQPWKGLLFLMTAYHCSLYLTFLTCQFYSQSQLPPKSRWTSNLVLIWVFLRYSYRE